MDGIMPRDDLLAFARRDWAGIEAEKARFWTERKASMSPAEALAVGDALRRHALKPGWPDSIEREAGLAVHRRVSEVLNAVSRNRPR